MSLDLSSLGSTGAGENLPEVLHAVADMVKAKGKLAKIGIGGSPLGYDPKKHLDETLQHLGLAENPSKTQAAPTAPAPGTATPTAGQASDVNPDHVKEIIAHLRQQGSGAAGQPPGSAAGQGAVANVGQIGGGGQGQTPFSSPGTAPAPGLSTLGQTGGPVVPVGSFTEGPDGSQVQLNPPGAQVTQPAAADTGKSAGEQMQDLKLPVFAFNPNGPKPPSTVPPDFMGEWQEANKRAKQLEGDLGDLSKKAESAIHGVYYYTDPKTGKEMMYEPPKPVELQKEIGGKKHSFADWATLGIALLAAAAGGKNGGAFAVGLIEGWFGGKSQLADQDTAQNDKEFANAQQARASKADGYLKQLGFKDNEIKNLYAHMDRTMNMQLRSDDQKAREAEARVRDTETARGHTLTAVGVSQGKYQTALRSLNIDDAKTEARRWRAAETGLPENERSAPTDKDVEAAITSARSSFHERQGATLQKGYLGLAQSAPDAKTASLELKEALKYMDPKSDEYRDWSQMAADLASGKHPWPKDQNFQMKVARAHLSTANMELMALGQRAAKGTWSAQDDADWANAQNEQQKALGDIDAIAQGGQPPAGGGQTGAGTDPVIVTPDGLKGPLGGAGGGMHAPKPGPSKEEQANIEQDKQLRVDAVKKVRELTLHADTYGMTRKEYGAELAKAKSQAEGDPANLVRKKDGTVDSAASDKAVSAAVDKATKTLNDHLKTEYDKKLDYFKDQAGLKKDGTQKWSYYGPKPKIQPVAQAQAKPVFERAKKLIQQYERAGMAAEAKKIKANFEKATGWGYDQPWGK